MTSTEERLSVVETNNTNVSKEISEIKKDIGEMKDDIVEIKLTIAKWSGGIIVSSSLIQIIINKFL